MDIAIGQEAPPPELDTMANVFAIPGERQEIVADKETFALLEQFALDPDVQKARAALDRAQIVEEQFHKDFDGIDFARVVRGQFYPIPVEISKTEGSRMAAHAAF